MPLLLLFVKALTSLRYYYELEQRFCHSGEQISRDEALHGNELRAFDARILHCIVCIRNLLSYNEGFFRICRLMEALSETLDDIQDYCNDVKSNTWNIVRAFVRLYGYSDECVQELTRHIDNLKELIRQNLNNIEVPAAFRNLCNQLLIEPVDLSVSMLREENCTLC